MQGKPRIKAQVAIDFLSSYGVAILIMIIAISVAYAINQTTTYSFSSECNPQPGFSCGYYSLTENGILQVDITQGIGSAITVNGAACSSAQSASGMPAYGNAYVANTAEYYPAYNAPSPGVTIYSDGSHTFRMYCYSSGNVIAKSSTPGASYVGYLWMNYTVQNTNIHSVQEIASLGLKYVVS